MISPFVVLFTSVLGVASTAAAPASEPMPSVQSILDGVIARDAQTQRELKTMEYDQSVHTERLDAKGGVTSRQDQKMIVRPGAAQEIQVVEVHGDNIPTDPDQAAQKAKGQELERRKQTFDLKSIATRFTIKLEGTSTELGPKAYVISFEPKANQAYHSQTEKVLNQLHGRMWIRASDDTILQTRATLLHPVSVAWIFASIDQLDFQYELPVGGSEYGPAWLATSVDVAAPLIRIHQRQRIDMTHFRPREFATASVKKM